MEPVFQVLKMQMAVCGGRPDPQTEIIMEAGGLPWRRSAGLSGTSGRGAQGAVFFRALLHEQTESRGRRGSRIRYFKKGRFETAMEHKPSTFECPRQKESGRREEKKARIVIREAVMEDAAAIAEMEHQIFGRCLE